MRREKHLGFFEQVSALHKLDAHHVPTVFVALVAKGLAQASSMLMFVDPATDPPKPPKSLWRCSLSAFGTVAARWRIGLFRHGSTTHRFGRGARDKGAWNVFQCFDPPVPSAVPPCSL